MNEPQPSDRISPTRRMLRYFDPAREGFVGRMLRLVALPLVVGACLACVLAVRFATTESGRFFVMSAQTEIGQYEMGLANAQDLIEDFPGANWHYYRLMAKNLRSLGRYDESLVAYDTAIDVFPDSWWPRMHRCFYTALLTGEAGPVLHLCDQAIEMDPTQPAVAYDRRAFVRMMAGDLDGATADLEIALEHFASAGGPYVEARLETRTQWLEELRAGGNPLTDEAIIAERALVMPAKLAEEW